VHLKQIISMVEYLKTCTHLESYEGKDPSRSNEELMYLIEDWAQFILYLPIRGRMHVGEQVSDPPYGRNFSYCTGGVFTLSEVLAKATGMRTDHYAQEKLFAPLGITLADWVYSPLSVPQTGGGMRMSS